MPDVPTSRRGFLGGCLTGASLAAVLADPALARAAAQALNPVDLTLPDGRKVTGALAMPPGNAKVPGILLVHEWWGLNDQIRSVAAALAAEGYAALAIDLYDGRATSSPEEAAKLMKGVDDAAASSTLVGWLGWLAAQPRASGKLATIGWCFGGGWSLTASILSPVDATVVYYGRVARPAEQLRRLKGPVLGHFATHDPFITHEIVARFEAAMKEAGKPYTVYWYDADHAFANPTGARYDAADAKLAWSRTLDFFAGTLKA